MEAPDKIYMPNELLSEEWQRHIEGEDTAYIRKDIVDETIKTAEDHAYFAGQEKFREELIEWEKEKLEDLKSLLDTDPYNEIYVAKCEVYIELIAKLNSI